MLYVCVLREERPVEPEPGDSLGGSTAQEGPAVMLHPTVMFKNLSFHSFLQQNDTQKQIG